MSLLVNVYKDDRMSIQLCSDYWIGKDLDTQKHSSDVIANMLEYHLNWLRKDKDNYFTVQIVNKYGWIETRFVQGNWRKPKSKEEKERYNNIQIYRGEKRGEYVVVSPFIQNPRRRKNEVIREIERERFRLANQ